MKGHGLLKAKFLKAVSTILLGSFLNTLNYVLNWRYCWSEVFYWKNINSSPTFLLEKWAPKGCFPKKLLKIFLKCKFLRTLTKLGYTLKLFNFLVVWFATSKAELRNSGQKIHKSRSRFLWLKVHSWKLYNNENMTVSTQITNTEIFAFVAFAVFKLLGHKFCL